MVTYYIISLLLAKSIDIQKMLSIKIPAVLVKETIHEYKVY